MQQNVALKNLKKRVIKKENKREILKLKFSNANFICSFHVDKTFFTSLVTSSGAFSAGMLARFPFLA